MIILSTAVLFHVCAKHGAIWEGIGVAWILGAFMDLILYGWLFYCIFNPSIS